MRVLVFTKPLGPTEPAKLADDLAALRVDGADLVVREGQTVTPADPRGILSVAKALAANGLGLDVVTTDLLDADPAAEQIIGACAEAGVPLVRTGFYRYDPAKGYRRCLDEARTGLARLVELGARLGVRVGVQIHHGTVHPSAALVLRLIGDLGDVPVYGDPGNQLKEGSEDWRLSLDLLGDRLACLGVKNAAWPRPDSRQPDWVPLAEGAIDWGEIIGGLREREYPGPLSLHVHYPAPDPLAALRADLDHLRRL